MSRQGEYGCFAEVRAAAFLFCITIVVYKFSDGEFSLGAIAEGGDGGVVNLLFIAEGVHYKFLKPEEDDEFIPCQLEASSSPSISNSCDSPEPDVESLSDISSDASFDFGPLETSDEDVVSDSEDEDANVVVGVRIGSSMQRPRTVHELSRKC